jgi:hypothetical protein
MRMMSRNLRAALAALAVGLAAGAAPAAFAQQAPGTLPPASASPDAPLGPAPPPPTVAPAPPAAAAPARDTYSADEIVNTGHSFFGTISGGLATVVEKAFADNGEPNGYILGQEASGAVFGGLRYGEGTLYTRNAGDHKVYWQGPSLGFDLGGDGARVMMLVYNLPSIGEMFQRYVGVNGSAYLVGGFGMTVLAANLTYVVPVRSGVGARLGVNLGYLKFTERPTWNPF